MRPPVCVLGSLNLDLTMQVPALPVAGQTVLGTSLHERAGGKGANQAVAAARWGAAVRFLGKSGPDAAGGFLRQRLTDEGIDLSGCRIAEAGEPTGRAVILVDPTGQNAIAVVPGANGTLSREEVRQSRAAIEDSTYLLASLEVPVAAVLEAFRIANSGRVITVLNPAPAQAIPDELLKRSEICTPNETELQQLTGLPTHSLEAVEAAARALRKRGAREVIVTLGDRGVFMLDGFGVAHLPAVRVDCVDSSGAGDCFSGVLAALLAEGLPIRKAAAGAVAAAGLSVTRPGTMDSFPRRAEVDSP